MEFQWTSKSQKNKAGELTFPDFKTYYKSYGNQTVWHWHKDTHMDQRNKTELP